LRARPGPFAGTLLALASVAGWASGPVVVDDVGRHVALAAPAERIVSLAPHATEMLFAAGAGERVVAVLNHSDHPPPASELPRVGGYDRVDVERILAFDPDLVVGWASGNAEGQLERLRALGLTLYVTEPRSLEAIAANVERLGRLAGSAGTARRAAQAFRERLARLREAHADRRPVEVFYEVWNRPLITVNGEHVISDVIRGCGGRNIFADLSSLAPRVSVEAVLARDPEVILASGMGDQRPDWLDAWRRWPELRAVAAGNLFFVPPSLLQRHAPRILDGMERLCLLLERARS